MLQLIATVFVLTITDSSTITDLEHCRQVVQTSIEKSSVNALDLDLVNNYVEALHELLGKGEAYYVMHASSALYHKLLQTYSSLQDMRLAQTQLHLGMLLATAQEYTLPWYKRPRTILQTYNHIENTILHKFDEPSLFHHEYAQLLAKRGRQHRVLWEFEAAEKVCEKGYSILRENDDFSLRTHFLCELAHIEATQGNELLWLQKLEEARRNILTMPPIDREKAFNQIDYIQGEGYKRIAFHVQKDLPISLRERYAEHGLRQFSEWRGASIELPGFESLVVQVSKAQCMVLLDPMNAIYLAEQLRKSCEHRYPSLLDKIQRVTFLAQQRLQMREGQFLQIFKGTSHTAYHEGKNIL